MMNNLEFDPHLNPVLENANKEELSFLHDIIMKKSTEMLSIQDMYKAFYPDHTKYVDHIAKEIRTFGGNSFANAYRLGEGPAYREIVCDVAKRIKVPFNKNSPIDETESLILAMIGLLQFESKSKQEKRDLFDHIGKSIYSALKGGSVMAIQLILKRGGFKSYKWMLIIVNALVKKPLAEVSLLRSTPPCQKSCLKQLGRTGGQCQPC